MRLRISRGALGDLALVAVSLALTELEIWTSDDVPGPRLGRALPLLLLLVLPMLLRRTAPLLAAALVSCAIVAYSVWRGSPEGIELIVPMFVVTYSVAAHSARRRAIAALALIVSCYAVYAAYDPNVTQRGSRAAENEWAAAFFGAALVAVWLLGVFVRSRREATLLATRTARAEHEVQLAVAGERARMARELHDIVSHNLSVVVLQAAGARAAGASASTLEKIERSGREALVEMRHLLDVLREEQTSATLAPQPGIAQLEELVSGVRETGLEVELTIDGQALELSPALELSVYRIVQEALTNTLKHAHASSARVHISRGSGFVSLEVVDDGMGATGPTGHGHGLVGMAERVAIFGGELRTGPRPGGGFVVRASLPVVS
ncbi:MAG TPA: sensor histidine kinase [Gaiellaceae bacterium]|nr:sensor histidine kinase [Gaiellaceae bacterium]